MKRRTLDLVFSVGGVLLAVLLAILGFVLKDNADFAKSYVHNQLSQQDITFTPVAGLTGDAKTSVCLNKYAETALDSGKKAECYANDYIALHLREGAKAAGQEGKTYASLGPAVTAAKKAVTDAKTAGKPTDELQKAADSLAGLRENAFKGETLRGLLLTSYGFSVFGEKGGQAEMVCFGAALVLLLASIAGFIHALTTPKDKVVAAVSHTA
ncbi:unannotated protein [freshwater metagenome]|uniref:Unannotated protein n=1 Tax=freshwater metagenome TaxID=449393 RepID=A0A6J7F418_9ZZZZ|nr:hypothetical protein [Actinomycetota bacterium]